MGGERGEERSETLWWHLGSVIPNRIVSYSEEETDRGRREKTTKQTNKTYLFNVLLQLER